MADDIWPLEIRSNKQERRLDVRFDDGSKISLPAEYLRVESPSAEVQGHGPGQRILISGKRGVGISRVESVGNYAVRLIFDDGHDSGIYSWRLLSQMAREHDQRWARYLAELDAAKATR